MGGGPECGSVDSSSQLGIGPKLEIRLPRLRFLPLSVLPPTTSPRDQTTTAIRAATAVVVPARHGYPPLMTIHGFQLIAFNWNRVSSDDTGAHAITFFVFIIYLSSFVRPRQPIQTTFMVIICE